MYTTKQRTVVSL